jgi:hypothetical protein
MKALAILKDRVARLGTAGLTTDEAALYFRAQCDGLAGLELGGAIPAEEGERLWRAGLATLIRGMNRAGSARERANPLRTS